jgi:hypothetical protein
MAILLVCLGLLVLGAALGCAAAVSFGMKSEDRSGSYRGLRNGARLGPLARVGRRIVGLSISPDTAATAAADTANTGEREDEDPPSHTVAAT